MVFGQQAEASDGQSEEYSESEGRSGICVDRHNRRIGSGEIKVIVALETADLEANWPFRAVQGDCRCPGKARLRVTNQIIGPCFSALGRHIGETMQARSPRQIVRRKAKCMASPQDIA